jgi:predicted RNA-binding protein
MAYFLNLFSPETYETFKASNREVSGFRLRQKSAAERIHPGDKLLCYMTRLSRWFGMFEVVSGPYHDNSPIYQEPDPYVIRFKIRPVILLEPDKSIPIHEDDIWNTLSFTKGHEKTSSTWTGKIRSSLVQIDDSDGQLLEKLLHSQNFSGLSSAPAQYRAREVRMKNSTDAQAELFVKRSSKMERTKTS